MKEIIKEAGKAKNPKDPPMDRLPIDITHRKIRLGDFIAEKVIKGVAFFSIAIIILIFIFVFRESAPVFSSRTDVNQNEMVQEQQETYGEVTGKDNTDGQSVYSGDTGNVKASGQNMALLDSIAPSYENESYKVSSGSNEDDNRTALHTLMTKDWIPVSDRPRYGILPLIAGTLKVTVISILFAAPLAILAALYSVSFAGRRMKEIIKPVIELLAGFPSVVIGFFALMVLATFLQNIFHYETRLNSFVGGIAMGIAAIPIIFTITEDALTAVPKTFYQASLALGASKWQTALMVILPAATPGIFAAILLGIGRIFGETMIALMATGNAALIGLNPFESVRTLAATIGAEMAEVVFGDTHYNVLFLIGSLLLVFTFILNAVAEFYVKGKLLKRIQGK
jgi:phosphate transport system permease protein